jgi:hypothetical protein
MSSHFTLISEIVLNNYIAKIYRFDTTTSYVDQSTIDAATPNLNAQQYPSEIVELLQVLSGVSKIEIYNKSNGLLISSGVLVE